MSTERGYPDLHDHLHALEEAGLLFRVRRSINKDTELHPLVRWQFRGGFLEDERRGFLFENVVDGHGHQYDIPVAVGVLSANREIYSLGIGCSVAEISQAWMRARMHPIPPVEIPSDLAPAHEIVWTGADLDVAWHGVDGLPVPVSTPGWDNAPYLTAAHYISGDPVLAFLNATPRVALLPLLILWVGIGIWSKVLLVVLGASFPILINTIAGVRSVDESLLQVAQAFRARGLFIFRTVVLPASVPFVLSGLRLGVGRGILLVVVAEFYASYNGIGHLISHAAQTLDAAESFAGVVVIALVGAIAVWRVRGSGRGRSPALAERAQPFRV